jgi:hypothetical protein
MGIEMRLSGFHTCKDLAANASEVGGNGCSPGDGRVYFYFEEIIMSDFAGNTLNKDIHCRPTRFSLKVATR